ncbi:MAG: SurA N-terminal domain-containing protein [Gammaproteobacteria bacterium]|nr:SurA N-terminal domain-containing protein [Gammaproteobacteria bacterium]
MLSSIRQHAKGWLGITLLALIAIPFAFTGVYSYMTGGGAVVVAKVNDREIGQREFANAYQSYRQQLQALLGGNFRPELLDEQTLRREALDRLIEEIVLVDTALEHGFRVGATQLAQRITSTPEFQTAGRFDRDLYRTRLAQVGLTPEQYEQQLRSQLLVEQLLGGLGTSSFVTEAELDEALRLQLQRRDVSYLVIPPADPASLPEPTEAELQAFYEKRSALFAEPEQVRLDYVELSIENLASAIGEPDRATLERLYEEEKSRFAADEERRARHILLEVPADADEATREQVMARAEALREKLVEGADFAELARAESEDPGSAAEGGDLGYFGRGMMDPAFESAAFALEVDEISEPIRSAFGYHLIQVTDVRGQGAPTFDEMADSLEEIYRRREAEQVFFDRSETLANLAYEHPDSLDAAAETLDLDIQRSPWLSRDDGEAWPLAEPRVLAAAFSPEVLDEGLNSQVLELGDGRLLVLRLAERKAARVPELDEIRDAVEERYRQERASELARERGEELLERLRSGGSLEALAAEADLEAVEVEGMRRDATAQPLAVVRTAFRLPRPAEGSVSATGVETGTGAYALILLRGVEAGEPDSQVDETRLREALARVHASSEMAGVVDGVRSRASIEINQENL